MANILITEDDPAVRKFLNNLLSKEGYTVFEAENGYVAEQIINSARIDLMITDIIMPEKEGVETIIDIKKKMPELKIIAISGGGKIGPHSYLKMAQTFGADRTFEKPFDPTDILNAIMELLG